MSYFNTITFLIGYAHIGFMITFCLSRTFFSTTLGNKVTGEKMEWKMFEGKQSLEGTYTEEKLGMKTLW